MLGARRGALLRPPVAVPGMLGGQGAFPMAIRQSCLVLTDGPLVIGISVPLVTETTTAELTPRSPSRPRPSRPFEWRRKRLSRR